MGAGRDRTMTLQEARETLEVYGETVTEARSRLFDAVCEAMAQLDDFDAAVREHDLEALREYGYISRRQCDDCQAALVVMQAAECEA